MVTPLLYGSNLYRLELQGRWILIHLLRKREDVDRLALFLWFARGFDGGDCADEGGNGYHQG